MRRALIASLVVFIGSNAFAFGQVPVAIPYGVVIPPSPPSTVFERNRDLVPTLIASLTDKDPEIHRNVTQALRSLGTDAIPSLIDVLNGKNTQMRAAAAILLGNMGPQAEMAMPTLLNILKNKKSPPTCGGPCRERSR